MRKILRKLAFASSIATFLTLPGWLERMIVLGSPIGESFVHNFHHVSHLVRYDEAVGLLLMALITVFVYVFDDFLVKHFPQIRGNLVKILGAFLFLYFLNWVRNRILFRTFGNEAIFSDFQTGVLYPSLFFSCIVLSLFLAIYLSGFFKFIAKFFVLSVMSITFVLVVNEGIGLVRMLPYLGQNYSLAPLQSDNQEKTKGHTKTRVVWVLLDGYDYKLAFSDEADNDPLFDIPVARSLRNKTIFATDAHSPAIDTYESIMSYFTGRKINPAIKFLPDDFNVQDSQHPGKESTAVGLETLFDELRSDGFNVAVASQAFINHPYCRMFNRSLSKCWQEGPHRAGPPNFLERTQYFLIEFIRNIPGFEGIAHRNLNFLFQKSWVENQKAFEGVALDLMLDPSHQFVFLHYTVPHAPYIRDYKTNNPIRPESYIDKKSSENIMGNMEVADEILGKIIEKVKLSSIAGNTLFIFTSDHGNKTTHVLFSLWDPKNEKGMRITKRLELIKMKSFVQRTLKNGAYDWISVGNSLQGKALVDQ